jgi:hypothetical protein
MICPWAGGAVRYRSVKKGPLPVGGIVLFWGAAIPGDIPHTGTEGTSPGVPSPRHDAWNAWKGPSECVSGPAPKPRSRVCPSVRSRPPRVSAPVGAQLLGSDEAREIPRWQLSAARAEPIRRTTPRRRLRLRACPTFRPALRARIRPWVGPFYALISTARRIAGPRSLDWSPASPRDERTTTHRGVGRAAAREPRSAAPRGRAIGRGLRA